MVRWVCLLTWAFGILQMPLPMLHQKNKLIIKRQKLAPKSLKLMELFFKKSIFFIWLKKLHSPWPLRSKTLFTPSLPSKMSMVYLPLSFSVGSLIWSQSCSPVTPDLTLSEAEILASLMEERVTHVLSFTQSVQGYEKQDSHALCCSTNQTLKTGSIHSKLLKVFGNSPFPSILRGKVQQVP